MGKNRIEYFDVLRGVAIICVIAIHSFIGLEDITLRSLSFHVAIIWRQLIGCAVPVFLAISGFFLSQKKVDSMENYVSFISKQIPRVYIPMLIWSFPYFTLSIICSKNLLSSFLYLITGGYSVYYFVILIVQYYLLLPQLQRLAMRKSGVIISSIISAICMLVLFYLTRIQKISIPLVVYAGPFPVWIVFFVIGLYLGKNKIKIECRKLILFTTLGLILSIVETYLHIYVSQSFVGLGIKIGSFAYSFSIILLLFSLNTSYKSNSFLWRFFVYLGQISFGIYLIHIYILRFTRVIVSKLVISNYYFINQLFLITLTLTFSVSIIYLARKINKQLATKYLGL